MENRDDECCVPGSTVANEQHYLTRCGRVSKPYNHAKDFPETSQFAHYQSQKDGKEELGR